MTTKRLLLVDYENVPKVDLSLLDESYSAIVVVGANQNPPKAARNKATAYRFSRVDFHKIEGVGKNALDFHIAFHLGRTFATAPGTECIVLSKDKGFDPLLAHLNKNGLTCRRVATVEEVVSDSTEKTGAPQPIGRTPVDEALVCKRCRKASTIEHHGGRWCTNCGCFASPPDPKRLPSNQPGVRESRKPQGLFHGLINARQVAPSFAETRSLPECGWCHQKSDMVGGVYDDGEWMCGDCIARYAT